jgi:hypothetical protein
LRLIPEAIRRERARRQLDLLDDHLRRDVGLGPRNFPAGWSDPRERRWP